MGIQIVCPNGHALKVKTKYSGKVGLCPFCKGRMRIPSVPQDTESSLSGLSIKVPEFIKDDSLPEKNTDDIDVFCSKCHEAIPEGAAVCPHCDTYVVRLPQ